MALRYYYFTAENLSLTSIQRRIGAGPIAFTGPGFTSTPFVVVEVDDALTLDDDLKNAMASEGYIFVNSTPTAPTFAEARDYGSQAADPTFPAPAESDRYWNSTSHYPAYYTGGAWGVSPLNVSGASVADALVVWSGTTGAYVRPSTGWTLSGAGLLSGSTGSLVLPQGVAPAPTAEGEIAWSTTNDWLVVGDGTGTKTFLPVNPTGAGIQGSIIYRDAAEWTTLAPPATPGSIFTTGGSGANPSWSANWTIIAGTLSGVAGSLVLPQAAAPAPTVEGQMAWSTLNDWLVVGDGTATRTFLPINPAGLVQGAVIYYDGTSLVLLGPGANGDYFTSGGPGADPTWSASAGGGLTQPQVLARIGFGGF